MHDHKESLIDKPLVPYISVKLTSEVAYDQEKNEIYFEIISKYKKGVEYSVVAKRTFTEFKALDKHVQSLESFGEIRH